MWDLLAAVFELLVAACGIEPGPPCMGAGSFSHWTTRKVHKSDDFDSITQDTVKGGVNPIPRIVFHASRQVCLPFSKY